MASYDLFYQGVIARDLAESSQRLMTKSRFSKKPPDACKHRAAPLAAWTAIIFCLAPGWFWWIPARASSRLHCLRMNHRPVRR